MKSAFLSNDVVLISTILQRLKQTKSPSKNFIRNSSFLFPALFWLLAAAAAAALGLLLLGVHSPFLLALLQPLRLLLVVWNQGNVN